MQPQASSRPAAASPAADQARTTAPTFALLCLEIDAWRPGRRPCRQALSAEQQDAVAAALTRAVRAEDSVSLLAGGALACLLNRPTSREMLCLLAWKLLAPPAGRPTTALPRYW